MTTPTARKLFALAAVVLLVGTGGFTGAVLQDDELVPGLLDGDGRETSVGNDLTNPDGVSLGNTGSADDCLGNTGNTGCGGAMISLVVPVDVPLSVDPAPEITYPRP